MEVVMKHRIPASAINALVVVILMVAAASSAAVAQTGACCTATSSTTFSCTPNVTSDTCTNSPTETWVFNQGCPDACETVAACCPAAGDCQVNNEAICTIIASGTFLPGETCTGDPCANLPVELSSFNATVDERDVVLVWRTESEDGNWGFEVESRLVDGDEDFAAIGFAVGHGSTTVPQNYEFRISDPEPGTHRLRLKQIDFDGGFAYSPEVEATVELPSRYYLEAPYPNPFNPTATVRFGTQSDEQISLTLYDSAGRVVRSVYEGSPEAGRLLSVSLNANGLPSGSYVLRLQGQESVSRMISIAR